MRAKSMKMGGTESFEHVQKPATAIQDHVSSPNSIYKLLRRAYDQYTNSHRSLRLSNIYIQMYDSRLVRTYPGSEFAVANTFNSQTEKVRAEYE